MSTAESTPFTQQERTEVELAAQILARLLKHQIIPLGMREEAQRVVGLQTAEVTEALRAPTWRWSPPRRVEVPAQPTKVTKLRRREPANPKFRNGRARMENADGHLYCKGCDEWLPPEQFTPRADRPGTRKAKCRACMSAYQAARYLTVKKIDALNQARVRFMVDEDSELIGMACADCGHPIVANDLVHVDGGPRHEVCEDRS